MQKSFAFFFFSFQAHFKQNVDILEQSGYQLVITVAATLPPQMVRVSVLFYTSQAARITEDINAMKQY